MTFWVFQADYRPLTEKSPIYLFCSETGLPRKEAKARFLARYQFNNLRFTEISEEDMEKHSQRKYIMWL